LASDLGLSDEQLGRAEKWQLMDSHKSERPQSFSINQTVEAASSQFEASRHATELKTDAHIKTVTKPENRNQKYLKPISGQGSASLESG